MTVPTCALSPVQHLMDVHDGEQARRHFSYAASRCVDPVSGVRVRRGRGAAYRHVWQWPLRSPARALRLRLTLIRTPGGWRVRPGSS